VGHPQVTKIYNEEKLYSVRSLVVVHVLNFQQGLVMQFICVELVICSICINQNVDDASKELLIRLKKGI